MLPSVYFNVFPVKLFLLLNYLLNLSDFSERSVIKLFEQLRDLNIYNVIISKNKEIIFNASQ